MRRNIVTLVARTEQPNDRCTFHLLANATWRFISITCHVVSVLIYYNIKKTMIFFSIYLFVTTSYRFSAIIPIKDIIDKHHTSSFSPLSSTVSLWFTTMFIFLVFSLFVNLCPPQLRWTIFSFLTFFIIVSAINEQYQGETTRGFECDLECHSSLLRKATSMDNVSTNMLL